MHSRIAPALGLVPVAVLAAAVAARTGEVWVGTGAADAVFRFDPDSETFDVFLLPTRGAVVRHLAVAPDGAVWLAYGASPGGPARVARLRP